MNVVSLLALLVYLVSGHQKQSDLIYILKWTYTYAGIDWPYRHLETGQQSFTDQNCSFQNCFVVSNRSYFENVLDYDVVLFNAVHYNRFTSQNFELPSNRSQTQQYLLFAIEPAAYNPIPEYLNGNINLTWTYRLDSDILHPYIVVKNHLNEVIGPKLDMHWMNINDMLPANNSIIETLKNKRLAALWIGSNCRSKDRIVYILHLQYELKTKYGLRLDIYGRCGNETACVRSADGTSKCLAKMARDYYFYLAFEDSNSEDYVSEKMLHALNHFTVPIVYGGADYRRFLPDGTYLDASKLDIGVLAKEMNDIINDPQRYYEFFKWHGYYKFENAGDDLFRNAVCEFCAFLNNQKRKLNRTVHVYENIAKWWNVPTPEDFPYHDSFHYYTVVPQEVIEPETTAEPNILDNILHILEP